MEKTIVMIDSGFLSKVSYQIGEDRISSTIFKILQKTCWKIKFDIQTIIYYTAPPFQDKILLQMKKEERRV